MKTLCTIKKTVLLAIVSFLFEGILHAQQNNCDLYVGDTFQGEMGLYDTLEWITVNAVEGGEYSIVLRENLEASSNVLDCNGKSVTISLKSSGSDIQLSYATRSPSSSLFTVKKGVTFVLENRVELIGRSSASMPPVTVDGGNFIMNGGSVRDSNVDGKKWFGGAVDIINGGTFTMNKGKISGNSASSAAGVNVWENSTFIMNGGSISDNTVSDWGTGSGFGGGVFVAKNAAFTMNGGEIFRNFANYGNGYGGGGGVYVEGTFTMNNGEIRFNHGATFNERCYGEGGGIRISGNGVFVMNGGEIRENSHTGIYLGSENGKIILNRGNIASNAGGGVYMKRGSFEMNGGSIYWNNADSGAGVHVSNTSNFIMNNGSIFSNTAYGNDYSRVGGGGVYVYGEASFTMNGGCIERNVAEKKATGGGGVFVDGMFVKSNSAGIIYGGDAEEEKANKAEQYGHAVYTKKGSRDTTAKKNMSLDSRKHGADGGWE